jgi:acetone carboxylase gamma subunit
LNSAIKIAPFNSDKYDNFAWSGTTGYRKHRYENLKYIFRLINSGCIDINNVKRLLSEWTDHDITSEQVDILFDKSVDKQSRMAILDKMSAKNAVAKCSIISQTFRCYKKYYKVYTDFSSLT